MVPVVQQTLILIPGLLCDATVWEPQTRALGRLLKINIADHGLCDSLGAMAEQILDTAPRRFTIAGHSMGGRVALEIWRRAPDRVEAMALFDTGATPLAEGAAGEREKSGRWRLAKVARSQGMRVMATDWLKNMIHPSRAGDSSLVEPVLAMFERKSPEIYEAQIRALIDRPDARALLPGISVPTLVLCGEDDQWAPVANHAEIAAAIPGSRFVTIPVCGHMTTLERPAAVIAALESLFRM